MPTESPRPLARQLLRVVLGTSDVSDRDLLARFVASRDEDAFAEIVRRHGPMVLAVCRRVTGRPHDAEDAFQAAFLVLARRAGHISRPELLANYLYGIAYRTALEARAARRRVEEHVVPAAPEPAAPPPPDDVTDLRRVIDEELARLPDKYRAAVVLCDLEGLPRAVAAAQMGIPEGTLSSRLAHARKVLAERLSRRGVTASATAIAAAFGREALGTAVPHTLTNTTVSAAVRFAPGGTAPPAVSPAVSSLTEGVLKTMLATRLRQTFAVGLLVCGLVGVSSALGQQFRTTLPVENAPPVVAYDPTSGVYFVEGQPKATEPKKYPAKGVEDDDVPYGTFPTQAVVRMDDGKLLVRQRSHYYESKVVATTGNARSPSREVTTYVHKSGVVATTHDPADVAVFDMKGNRLAPKTWKDLFRSDVHVLVSTDGKLPNPRELALFKQDTLLVILPTPIAPATVGTTVDSIQLAPGAPVRPGVFAPSLQPAPAVVPPRSTTPAPRPGQSGPLLPTPALPGVPSVPSGTVPPAPTAPPADAIPASVFNQ